MERYIVNYQIQHDDSATNHLHVTTTETSGKLGKIDVSIKGDKSKNESKYFLSAETILNSDEMTSQLLVCAQTVLKVSLLVLHHFYAVFLFN